MTYNALLASVLLTVSAAAIAGCRQADAPAPVDPKAIDRAALSQTARSIFGVLPTEAKDPDHPVDEAKIKLGRQLYFDERLSVGRDLSCNSCHDLEAYGVDARTVDGKRTATSMGHKGQMGDRNSPSVYNAALHVAQFWDGRAPNVEAQAVGPVTNPVEMAMPDPGHVVGVLKGIPGYVAAFERAFPGTVDPVTYENMGEAIGAFERRLITPAPFDRFVGGDLDALTEAQVRGLETFVNAGCMACHNGPTFGGQTYQKMGLVKTYPMKDAGRFAVTKADADKFVLKVPSLRNIAKTGPYLHDGSVYSLEKAIRIMAEYQVGRPLSAGQVDAIVTFLDGGLTGQPNREYIAKPELPPSS